MALTVVFLLAGLLQLVHALVLGRPISGVGGEFRALLGFGVLFVALPVLADPRQRRLLLKGLGCLGLALGVWGIAQFAFHLQFTDADLPAGPVGFQTAGRTVGLFAFPVAATLALAVLSGGHTRPLGGRVLLAAVVVTNLAAVVMTFERTFLLVTLVGFGLVFLRGTWTQRTRLALLAPVVIALSGLVFALVAPSALSAYGDRLLTLDQRGDRSGGPVSSRGEPARGAADPLTPPRRLCARGHDPDRSPGHQRRRPRRGATRRTATCGWPGRSASPRR